MDSARHIFIGYDGREAIASEVAAHSILRRTQIPISVNYLKHRELRAQGMFTRPWLIDGQTGDFVDLVDGKAFSTEFSHTRFLVPALMHYRGWALVMDADMIFLSDAKKLFSLCDERYAIMCVPHTHVPANNIKMDGRTQARYRRKNWSSFMLINCGHEANLRLTPEYVSFAKGSDLHSFAWLDDSLIGALPFSYNYISTVSPKLPPERGGMPDVLHFTDGGPWMNGCENVPYAGKWVEEYEDYQVNAASICAIPSMAFEKKERTRK